MDSIEKLKKEIADNEFHLKTSEKNLRESLLKVKTLAEDCEKKGILNSEQLDMISNLNESDLVNFNLESFKEISSVFQSVKLNIDSKITELTNTLNELEGKK